MSTIRGGGKLLLQYFLSKVEAAIVFLKIFDFVDAHVFVEYGMSYAGNRGRQS